MSRHERFDEAPCGLVLVDAADVVIDANSTLGRWVGTDPGDLRGTPFPQLLTQASTLYYETRWRQSLGLQGEVSEVSLTLSKADGTELPALANARVDSRGRTYIALFEASGRLDYERGLLSARRDAVAAVDRVRTLQEAAEAFTRVETEHELVDELTERARQTFAASRASVVLVGADGLLHSVGRTPHPLGEEWLERYGTPASGTVAIESLDDVPYEPEMVDGLRRQRIEALTSTPITHAEDQLGRLLCFFGRARRLDEDALDLQRALGRLAATALVRLRLQRDLERRAHVDQLTGLPNRSAVLQAIAAAVDSGSDSLVVIFIDLDGFKEVNDRHGHATGDAVLRETARRIRSSVREEDVVGRLGGDEFIVLAHRADAIRGAEIAERARAALDDAHADLPLRTASLGVASIALDRHARDADALVNLADEAMYRAKAAGKNRVVAL